MSYYSDPAVQKALTQEWCDSNQSARKKKEVTDTLSIFVAENNGTSSETLQPIDIAEEKKSLTDFDSSNTLC